MLKLTSFISTATIAIATLSACGGDNFPITGTVAGLTGTGLVLTNNGGDDLTVSANAGEFEFKKPLKRGANYSVEVKTQPTNPSQNCVVTNGTGKAGDAVDITVTCTVRAFTIGGNVSGLDGTGFVIQNNGGDNIGNVINGAFTFSKPVLSGTPYNVTVLTQPSMRTQNCTISRGTGTVGNSDVTDVDVSCLTSKFTLSVAVNGLTGTGLVLQNNGADDLSIPANGSYTFSMAVPSGDDYAITVKTHPTGPTQYCSVMNGSGTIGAANISGVAVDCTTGAIWSPTVFPMTVPNTSYSLGDMAFDAAGNLLVTNASPGRSIVKIDRQTNMQTVIASSLGTGYLMAIAYRQANNMIYVGGDGGQVYAVTPGGMATQIATTTHQISSLAIAPPTFGTFGGFIIAGSNNGVIFALDPMTNMITTITTAAGPISDIGFAPDGTLYGVGGALLKTITATGTVTTIASNYSSADGITFSADGTKAFIADAGVDLVYQLTIPGLVRTTIGSYDIDDGWGTGGILADSGNTCIVMVGETSLTLRAFSF